MIVGLCQRSLHKAQVGRRLRAAIEALGITQTEVGRALGVAPSKLGNWLRGDNYPTPWFVKRFCDRYGMTTEWIYRGIVTGLPSELGKRALGIGTGSGAGRDGSTEGRPRVAPASAEAATPRGSRGPSYAQNGHRARLRRARGLARKVPVRRK